MSEDEYEVHARYYDAAYEVNKSLVDLPFYLKEAEKSPGPILEIGCGTGRITKEIAKLGKEVIAVDSSAAMLGILRDKLQVSDLAGRIHLQKGDIRQLELNRKFPLIILPFRVLQHLYCLEDQVNAFKNVTKHLEPGGRVIFDVFYPQFHLIYGKIGELVEEFELTGKDGEGKRLRRTYIKDRVDKIEQSYEGRFIYQIFAGKDCLKEEIKSIKMAFYTVPHLKLLLRLAGLQLLKSYGTFAKRPLDNTAQEIIIIAGLNNNK